MKVNLWLRVENNNKFVREKSKVREEIERYVLSHYSMEKLNKNGWEYILSIPYTTEEELENIIYRDIFAEAESHAYMRNCFIEVDMNSLDDPERRW